MDGSAGSDRSRVIFSPAFRRLQQKTQVFPLEDNAAVRSRLTHSIEVADIGRTIAGEVATSLGLSSTYATAFRDMVETACLMHDLGNPPFGHFGEEAIRRWFEESGLKAFLTAVQGEDGGIDAGYTDFYESIIKPEFNYFDGNPQGIRIALKLQDGGAPGMNLSFGQVLSAIKYPFCATDNPEGKAGYFWTERDDIEKALRDVGLSIGCRFPLSYIMEAADDIAFCMSDLEDGLEKKLIRIQDIRDTLGNEGTAEPFADALEGLRSADSPFRKFKVTYARTAIQMASNAYVKNHSQILSGSNPKLRLTTDATEFLDKLKGMAGKWLFSNHRVQNLELAGFKVIHGILEAYRALLVLPRVKFHAIVNGNWRRQGLDVEARLYNLLPEKHALVFRECAKDECSAAEEWLHRAHLIVDSISGMTDDFALLTYQRLSGIDTR